MLTCQELTELITDYLEGRLPLARRLSFQMHLGMCRNCRAYVEQMRATLRAVGATRAQESEMPAEVRDELMRRFRDWKNES